MTASATAPRRQAHEVRRLSPDQRWLRLLVLVTPPLVLFCALRAGAHPSWRPWTAVTLSAVLAAASPQSLAPGAAIAVLAGYWAVWVPATNNLWSLVAAILVLLLHSAAALAALGPPGLRLDRVTTSRWGLRVLTVLVVTTLTWVATQLAEGIVGAGSLLVSGVALAVLATALLGQHRSSESG